MTATRKLTLSERMSALMWDAEVAAFALQISKTSFLQNVQDGTLPKPVTTLGKRQPRWPRAKIEAIINAMSNESASHSIEESINAYASKIRLPRQRSARQA